MVNTTTMTYILTSLISIKCLLNFKSKLMILILMELLFVTSIMVQVSQKYLSGSMMIMLVMTVFMVLDSTMGVSILMASSRNSYLTMSKFATI